MHLLEAAIKLNMALPERGKILVISPHLDDAVFSCGEWMARFPGTVVATAFAGIPADARMTTPWDTASGFENAAHALSARREEDRKALQLLDAAPIWLDFCDSQYHATPSMPALAESFEQLLRKTNPATVLFPAGLFHSDHALVHEAMLCLLPRHPDKTWLMYEESTYRHVPGALQRRLAELLRQGMEATPVQHPGGRDHDIAARKREAVHCYASQLRALQDVAKDGYAAIFGLERCWRLASLADRR